MGGEAQEDEAGLGAERKEHQGVRKAPCFPPPSPPLPTLCQLFHASVSQMLVSQWFPPTPTLPPFWWLPVEAEGLRLPSPHLPASLGFSAPPTPHHVHEGHIEEDPSSDPKHPGSEGDRAQAEPHPQGCAPSPRTPDTRLSRSSCRKGSPAWSSMAKSPVQRGDRAAGS